MTELKKALKQQIADKIWLDNTTKKLACDKVDNITDFLGFPALVTNDTAINEYFAMVSEGGEREEGGGREGG